MNFQPNIVTALFTHIAHHKRARLNNFHDQGYAESMFKMQKFIMKTALIGLAGAATVFLPVAPFTAGLYYGIWNYWRIHAKSHLDPEYAKTVYLGIMIII